MTLPVAVGAYPISESEFDAMLTRVDRFITRIGQETEKLFANCNRVANWLPGFLADRLVSALNTLNSLLSRFFTELAKIVANPGWPPGVLSTAGAWTSDVGGPVSGMVGRLTGDQLRADNHWQGPAAQAYADMLPTQQAALSGIKQLTDELDSNLTKVGWGIVALWAGLAIAVGSFVAELIVEAAAAATVVGAPPAAAGAGASTVKVIALVGTLAGAFLTYIGLMVESLSSMRQKLADQQAYPGGNWPRSTTSDISDGSLRDGDGTDWRMSY